MIESGTVVAGKYKIMKKIGQGGMSTVYLAEDLNLHKRWTIKEIKKKGDTARDKVNLKSLIDEANLIKNLDHAFIPRVVDIMDTSDTVFIVRDYIDGEPMDQIIRNFGAQPEKSVIEWAKILCDIYLYLHSRTPKVIYRDMKPANIMLVSDGTLRLIDFGIAQEGMLWNKTCVGTKGFASPEQFRKDKITDERSDIYSLGMTLYQMATNINPAGAGFDKNVLVSQINSRYSKEFAEIIDKCIQDNPEDRYQNCSELLYALNRLSSENKENAKKFSLMKVLPYFAVALGTLCLCLGMGEESMLNIPESWLANPIFNFKNICLVFAVGFYALFVELRYLSVKKAKLKDNHNSIKGETNQYIVPTVPQGSLFDAIQNPVDFNNDAAMFSQKFEGEMSEYNQFVVLEKTKLQENVSLINKEIDKTLLSDFEEKDEFETGGTQLLGYTPEAESVTESEEDEFETGGTQLLGYAPEAEPAAELEEDEFETGGTQLLGYAPEAEPAAELEEDEFETGGTQLLGYAPEAEPAAELEEDEFETGGTQLLGYAPEAESVTESEEDEFETGGTQLLGAETETNTKKRVEPISVHETGYNPVEKESDEDAEINSRKNTFKIVKREIMLASDDIVS